MHFINVEYTIMSHKKRLNLHILALKIVEKQKMSKMRKNMLTS